MSFLQNIPLLSLITFLPIVGMVIVIFAVLIFLAVFNS